MTDPNYLHEFRPNQHGLCQHIASGSICRKQADAIVHKRYEYEVAKQRAELPNTPLNIYWRAVQEIDRDERMLLEGIRKRREEVKRALNEAQEQCSPHVDDGGFIYGHCLICGKDMG